MSKLEVIRKQISPLFFKKNANFANLFRCQRPTTNGQLKRIIGLIFLLASLQIHAQQSDTLRHTTSALLVGVGRTNLLETYLSPREYTGVEMRVTYELSRPMKWADGRFSRQIRVEGNFASTENTAKQGHEYGALLRGSLGYHYHWNFGQNLRLMAGALYDLNIGVIHNRRNSNNPAQAKTYTQLLASGAAAYHFRIRKTPLMARYQIDMPLAGITFSPNYGQSYYEMFLQGNYDHNVCLTYPGNAPSWRQSLTIDVPLRRSIVRLGYLFDVRQSHLNNLKYHAYSHLLMIGFVHYIHREKPHKQLDF